MPEQASRSVAHTRVKLECERGLCAEVCVEDVLLSHFHHTRTGALSSPPPTTQVEPERTCCTRAMMKHTHTHTGGAAEDVLHPRHDETHTHTQVEPERTCCTRAMMKHTHTHTHTHTGIGRRPRALLSYKADVLTPEGRKGG